ERTRLKPEHRHCTSAEIIALKRQGVEVMEKFLHVILGFTGDTGPGLDPTLFQDAEILIHEANFLRPEDREGLWHSTAEEALTLAAQASIRTLILYHISQRYRREEIAETIPALKERVGFTGHVCVVLGLTHPGSFY